MRSFIDLDRTFAGQPRELGVTLARIDTGRGREQLFLDQVPQVLRQLSENARIASITASNAIEGVIVDSDRAIKIADGAPRFRNRNEKEFAGYRDAIDGLMRADRKEPLSLDPPVWLRGWRRRCVIGRWDGVRRFGRRWWSRLNAGGVRCGRRCGAGGGVRAGQGRGSRSMVVAAAARGSGH